MLFPHLLGKGGWTFNRRKGFKNLTPRGGYPVPGGIPDYATEQRHIIDNVIAFLWNPYEFLGVGWVCQLIKYSITVVTDKLSEQLIDELIDVLTGRLFTYLIDQLRN